MAFTSRDFACPACDAVYDDIVQSDEMHTTPCRECGHNYLTVLISVPRIQKKEIELRTHDRYMTEDGKVVMNGNKAEDLVRAQWKAKKEADRAKKAGDKQGAAEARQAMEGYKTETKKALGTDRPAQAAKFNGSKIQ